ERTGPLSARVGCNSGTSSGFRARGRPNWSPNCSPEVPSPRPQRRTPAPRRSRQAPRIGWGVARLSVTLDATAIPEQVGGVGRYVGNLVSALASHPDLDLTVITRTGDRARWARPGDAPGAQSGEAPGEAPGAQTFDGAPPVVLDTGPRSRPARIAWEQARLPSVLRRLGPAAHHGTHYEMPLLSRIPAVVTIHDMTFVDHPEWHERWKVAYFRRAIRLALRRAAVLVCVSQATADRLQAYGRP